VAGDGAIHVAYDTALRTLCGKLVDRVAASGDASCAGCIVMLEEHRELGLARE